MAARALVGLLGVLLAGCSLLVPDPATKPLGTGYGPATWALDPAFAAPAPETTELNILVWESDCNGGTLIVGRMAPPMVEYQEATVTIIMRVKPLGGAQTCPLGPGTPALISLTEPLGDRTLLDGGREPPSEPSPPF